MIYHYRRNATEPETTLTPGDLALDLVRGAVRTQLPYAEITRVRLTYNPSRIDIARYECHIYHRGGDKLVITSTSYKGFGRFENQPDDYRACIEDIHNRLAGHKGIEFISGDTPKRYWSSLGCAVTTLMMLAVLLLITGLIRVPAIAIAKIVILLLTLPWVIKYAKVNKPGGYDPSAILPGLLP